MEKKEKKPNGYWNNYENCYNEAKKYKSSGEFCRKNQSAYRRALENKWLDSFDFKEGKKPNGYWQNYDRCYEEAMKYSSRGDFQKWSNGAYDAARKNEWLDDYYWFEEIRKKRGYWNYDNCYEEALKYKTSSDFERGNGSAYQAASKNGWIAEYLWFEKGVDRGEVYWIYAYEDVENKVVYVGLTFRKRRYYEHKTLETDSARLYFESINKPLPEPRVKIDGLNAEDAQYYEDWYKQKYAEAGWKVLNRAKTGVGSGSLGSGVIKWDYEHCKKEAKKYKTRTDFCKGNGSAYVAACRNSWLDSYTFFKEVKRRNGYWENNYDNCCEEAKKYKTRTDFSKYSGGAYKVALKNGWLDEFFPKAA